jgi:hypothetical protein
MILRSYLDKRLKKYYEVRKFIELELHKYENVTLQEYDISPRMYFYDGKEQFIGYVDIWGMNRMLMDWLLYERGFKFKPEYAKERDKKPYFGSFYVDRRN